jgi:GT2 family glycosyltransferase
VIVPATDRPQTLERCLEALRTSSEPPDELIVVSEPAEAGPAAARNAGVATATSEVVVFVDADVAVEAEALARLRRLFAADPGLAAAFGSYDDAPADPGVVSRFRNLLHHHVHTSSPGPAQTFWAGLGAVRRDAFLAAGGFDAERFGEATIEDIELGTRMYNAGASIVLDPEIRGTHLKRWSLSSMVSTDLRRRGVPWVRLQLEAGQVSGSLNLSWRHRLSAAAALVIALAACARRPRAAATATAGLIALNAGFYGLLRRRGGIALVVLGVPLHILHHLISVLSVAIGATEHLLAGRPGAAGQAAAPPPPPR